METSLNIDVSTLDAPHRRALEEVIGRQLTANQRLLISVIDVALPPSAAPRATQTLEDWTNVYDGLRDDEVEAVDTIAKTRANLTRSLPERMDPALLDTDILSEMLKRKDRQYLSEHQRLAFSAITLYEIVRGLLANRATRPLAAFRKTASTGDVFSVSVPVLLRAAELWADARVAGHPHDDADLIIAATALEGQRVLVTGNTAHFSWIPGLRLEDWRQP